MAPNHEVEEFRKQIQAERALRTARLEVLVDQEEMEPVVRVGRLEERHLLLFEHARQTLVGHIAHSVKS